MDDGRRRLTTTTTNDDDSDDDDDADDDGDDGQRRRTTTTTTTDDRRRRRTTDDGARRTDDADDDGRRRTADDGRLTTDDDGRLTTDDDGGGGGILIQRHSLLGVRPGWDEKTACGPRPHERLDASQSCGGTRCRRGMRPSRPTPARCWRTGAYHRQPVHRVEQAGNAQAVRVLNCGRTDARMPHGRTA